ncbi:MAG: hypothetical protein ACR2NA_09940 [Solirubrobacterales bacterium]
MSADAATTPATASEAIAEGGDLDDVSVADLARRLRLPASDRSRVLSAPGVPASTTIGELDPPARRRLAGILSRTAEPPPPPPPAPKPPPKSRRASGGTRKHKATTGWDAVRAHPRGATAPRARDARNVIIRGAVGTQTLSGLVRDLDLSPAQRRTLLARVDASPGSALSALDLAVRERLSGELERLAGD